MSLPVRVRPEAERDLRDAYDWYENQLAGLGARCLERVDQVMARISENPALHAITYRDIRHTLVAKFPYTVCYIANPSEVEIVAVFHVGRDPDLWQARTPG